MTEKLPHPVQLSQFKLRSVTAGLNVAEVLDPDGEVAAVAQGLQGELIVTVSRMYGGATPTMRKVELPLQHLLLLARMESDHPARAPVAPTPLHVPGSPKFGGKTFDPEKDEVRLTKGLLNVFDLMKDSRWRTIGEIAFHLHTTSKPMTQAGISARLRDLRKPQFGGHIVFRERVEETPGLFRYRLAVKAP